MLLALLGAALLGQDLQFAISTVDGRSLFYLGEVIALDLRFIGGRESSDQVSRREWDRVGRMNYEDEFLVEPGEGFVDPLRGLDGEKGGMGGLAPVSGNLREGPVVVRRYLNDWVRFVRPGVYTLRVKSRRVDGKELESNVLRLEIVEAPGEWVKEEIARAVTGFEQDRLQWGRVLRSLESVEAHKELLRRTGEVWDIAGFWEEAGVLGSPYRKELLAEWEARLVRPEQAVTERYLRLGESLSRRKGALEEYSRRLWEALPGKRPEARAVCLAALAAVPQGAWAREFRAVLADEFGTLGEETRYRLLWDRWSTFGGEHMVSALKDSLASERLRYDAMLRLRQVAPEEADAVVRAEIVERKYKMVSVSLMDLPEATVPEWDEMLLQRGDMLLAARYASAAALPKVRTWFESWWSGQGCRGPLLFYFLRHDAEYGKELVRQELARESAPPACYSLAAQYGALGQRAYSPALEEVAIEALRDAKVGVKVGAAQLLRKHGSAAGRDALWEAMNYLQQWWKGREMNPEAQSLEESLAKALREADGWALTEKDKARLLGLCRSHACRYYAR